MKETINTKRVGDKWYCFGTIDGYDESFEGSTQKEAEGKMRVLLLRKGIMEVKWTEVKYHPATKDERIHTPLLLNGIDFNPIA